VQQKRIKRETIRPRRKKKSEEEKSEDTVVTIGGQRKESGFNHLGTSLRYSEGVLKQKTGDPLKTLKTEKDEQRRKTRANRRLWLPDQARRSV